MTLNPSPAPTPVHPPDFAELRKVGGTGGGLRTLILGLFLALSAVSLVGLSILTTLLAISSGSALDSATLLTLFLLSGGLFFSGMLLLPGAYLNGHAFFNLPDLRIRFPAVNTGILFAALATSWAFVLILGQTIASNSSTAILLPVLNILAVAIPVTLFLRIALRRLELPPARQAWSVFGVTLVAGPVLGTILEAIALIVFMFAVGLYIASNPALAQEMTRLAQLIQNSSGPDTVVTIIAPLLFTKAGMLVVFGLLSVAVPAIEEAAKVVALWIFADKIKHPAQGFALGVLCGAAFAVAENLGFSSTSSSGANDWAATVALRASSALPHMLNSGILGWALVLTWKERAYLKLGMAYLAVMLIHGLWNAISVAMFLNSMVPYAQPSNIPQIIANPIPLFTGWIVMILGTFCGLIYCNQVLRRSFPAQAEYNEPLS